MKNILIVMGRYLPGYKGGGPGRSIANLVETLGDEYVFFVSCYDRDLGDITPYSNVKLNDWNTVGKASVFYLTEGKYTIKNLTRLYKNKDIIYLCGCFNDYAIKTLLLKRIGYIKAPVIVASMGLFSPLAFNIKYKKKKLFTRIFNATGVFKRVAWSVTSEIEMREVKKLINATNFYVVQDLPRKVERNFIEKNKKDNKLNIIFLSRITRKKNLSFALEVLKDIPDYIDIIFDIYGTLEDKDYWKECVTLARSLPENVKWNYCGEVKSNNVVNTFQKYQVFLFPTLGENYGHVIQEALSGGCICILSDQTPWQNLEKEGVGYVLNTNDKVSFLKRIIQVAEMDLNDFQCRSDKAVDYAVRLSDSNSLADAYRKMFDSIEN